MTIIVGSRGITLPYSSLFNVTLRDQSTRPVKSRPSDFFWKKATGSSFSTLPGDVALERDNEWLDSCVPALSDSEDGSITQPTAKGMPTRPNKTSRFTNLRRIAFKAFTPKLDDAHRKDNIVTSTEIIFRQKKVDDFEPGRSNGPKNFNRMTIFKSLRFKSGGSTQARRKKMVAILKNSISADSPLEEQPKTWHDYSRLYASEKIDIDRPPLPPFEPDNGKDAPSAFQAKYFAAPIPANESVRQLVMNRIGFFGGKPYDDTERGLAKWKERVEIGSKLMEDGKDPSSLASSWQNFDSSLRNDLGMQSNQKAATGSGSETLEQHPVLRRIAHRCREMFGAAFSLLSVMDDDRMIILAESGMTEAGLGGIRDAPREVSFCGHTILGDRKGLTILDARKDWRFQNNPSVQSLGPLFYAGVPLMSPNLDGSQEAERNAFPLGSLCICGFEPREAFTVEDRKKLIYMSEYARREIENWFTRKMENKRDRLTASEENWNHEVKRVVDPLNKRHDSLMSEAFSNAANGPKIASPSSKQPSSKMLKGIGSIFTSSTSPSLHPSVPLNAYARTRAGLFEDFNAVLNPQVRKVMDLATRLVGETLDLSLVYLTAVLPPGKSDESGRTMIVSGHNVPVPAPVFDAGLHLRALRAPEGGLLYQNPSNSEAATLQPKIPEPGLHNGRPNPYASAMIFAVGDEAYDDSGGFVLAGFTDDPKRVFGAEDAVFMKKFAQELSAHTSKLQLSRSTQR